MLSAAALAAHAGADGARGWLRDHDAGTGPYRLAANGAAGTALARFDGYWGAAPHFAAIAIATVPDATTQALRLRLGALDAVADVYPPGGLGALPPSFSVAALPGLTMLVALVNPLGRLKDELAREAVLTALNPKFWVPAAFGTRATPAATLFPEGMLPPQDEYEFPDDRDVARRKVVMSMRGAVLSVGFPAEQAAALRLPVEFLLAQLRTIGVDATARAVARPAAGDFPAGLAAAPDLFVTRAVAADLHPQALLRGFFASDAPGNLFGRIDPATDRAMQEADAAPTPVAGSKLYLAAGERLFTAGGVVPLADLRGIVVHRSDLSGLAAAPGLPPGGFDFAQVTEAP